MEATPSHQAAEAHFRQFVASNGIDPPDDVEYRDDSLVFFWQGPKVAVVFELEDESSVHESCGSV